jgi:NodT family efflux transporter outer membrane factor (OMF) lipoprotein
MLALIVKLLLPAAEMAEVANGPPGGAAAANDCRPASPCDGPRPGRSARAGPGAQCHPHPLLNGLIVCLLLIVVLTGCATRPATRNLATRQPPPFSATGQVVMPDRWWTAYGDPALNQHVEQALAGNFTLASALQRLRAARALTRREASDLLPDVDGIIFSNRIFGPGPDPRRFEWGLDAAYQIDLWGEIQSRVEAERFRAEATLADYHAVALSLAAEVARTWFSLIEARAQLELLAEQTATNRAGLVAQELRFGRGFVTSADVLRQRQLVQSTLEQEVVVRARIEVLEHQLAVLLGQLPQEARYNSGAELPALPPLPSTGVPSELLMRRPDVRRDYLAFVAADRDLASAISAQYPRFSLTGSLRNIAESPEMSFRDWYLSIGSQLIAPLVDGGQRRAEVDRTAAVVAERYNEYGQTMLIAFREVEDNLALERYQKQRIERLEAQVRLAEQASLQLRERYLIGDSEYLDVLSAIQSQQSLQRENLSARLELILIRIGLYLALAGDFDTRPQNFTNSPPDWPAWPPDVPETPPGLEELPRPLGVDPEIDVTHDARTPP